MTTMIDEERSSRMDVALGLSGCLEKGNVCLSGGESLKESAKGGGSEQNVWNE
jgi:hypothetical protein